MYLRTLLLHVLVRAALSSPRSNQGDEVRGSNKRCLLASNVDAQKNHQVKQKHFSLPYFSPRQLF